MASAPVARASRAPRAGHPGGQRPVPGHREHHPPGQDQGHRPDQGRAEQAGRQTLPPQTPDEQRAGPSPGRPDGQPDHGRRQAASDGRGRADQPVSYRPGQCHQHHEEQTGDADGRFAHRRGRTPERGADRSEHGAGHGRGPSGGGDQRSPRPVPPARAAGHLAQQDGHVEGRGEQEERAGVGDHLHHLPPGAVGRRLGVVGREPAHRPPGHPDGPAGPARPAGSVGHAPQDQPPPGHGDPASVRVEAVGVEQEDLLHRPAVRRVPRSCRHR